MKHVAAIALAIALGILSAMAMETPWPDEAAIVEQGKM